MRCYGAADRRAVHPSRRPAEVADRPPRTPSADYQYPYADYQYLYADYQYPYSGHPHGHADYPHGYSVRPWHVGERHARSAPPHGRRASPRHAHSGCSQIPCRAGCPRRAGAGQAGSAPKPVGVGIRQARAVSGEAVERHAARHRRAPRGRAAAAGGPWRCHRPLPAERARYPAHRRIPRRGIAWQHRPLPTECDGTLMVSRQGTATLPVSRATRYPARRPQSFAAVSGAAFHSGPILTRRVKPALARILRGTVQRQT